VHVFTMCCKHRLGIHGQGPLLRAARLWPLTKAPLKPLDFDLDLQSLYTTSPVVCS
jgi:hypothetical protein